MAYTTIDDPSAYFHTRLYTGTGSSQAVTNNANSGNFKPDWLWIKCRSNSASHKIFDTSRLDGSNNSQLVLQTDATSAENDVGDSDFTSIDTNGFTVLGANPTGASSRTYVAWQWKSQGGSTSSNTDGSITSTVQANTTAGFSIVTYTGTQANATVGHGLGKVPAMLIIKCRDASAGWQVFHKGNTSAPETELLRLNETSATADNSLPWNDTYPTSTVFTIGANDENNKSGDSHVAYCFAEKQGYSKFGSYTGNGNADGPMVFCGFKPAWVMFKKTSGTDGWGIFDNKRGYQNATNPLDAYLVSNNANAESGESDSIDFLSNGFKWRISSGLRNESGSTYIYMAFAEHPFVSSEGVPTTAR